ncbi:MAG: GAF domain-containing protein [Chloroflexi bacterium]|nr:GAF domain-containing protein [Chloroflexota bacterium]
MQKRVGLLVLAGLVVGLGLFSWLGVQSVNESIQRTLSERLVVARAMASHLDETLNYVLYQLQDVDLGGSLTDAPRFQKEAISLRQALARAGIFTRYIIAVDNEGIVRQAEPPAPELAGPGPARFAEIDRALSVGLPMISDLVSIPSDMPVVIASVPVYDTAGETMGLVAAMIDLDLSSNDAFNSSIIIGQTGYMEIVDGNGIVLVRTVPGSRPASLEQSDHPGRFADLIERGQATVGTCHRCHESQEAEVVPKHRDMLAFAPLSTASWGVVLRQAEEEALAPARQLGQRLLLLGSMVLVITFLLLWLVLQGTIRPIKMLTTAARRVASGDFRTVIPITRGDEIGQLSTAFRSMTQQLARSREELLSRNEELSAINSIAVAVNQSLNLEDVLVGALEKVLEVTRTTAGCVFLKSAGDKLKPMIAIGPTRIFQCEQAGLPLAGCACHQVLHHNETLMVNDASQCPMLAKDCADEEEICCFVSLPLRSKDKTLGVINVACSEDRIFTENDFKILDSIGYYVSLAIENSVLYQDAKQEEELRGELLKSVINAQEEERKRIARELHDEYGQTMTGLMMSIESLEGVNPASPLFKKRLEHAKSLVTRALKDTRRLTLGLRPSTLDDLGLIATVRSYLQNQIGNAGIKAEFVTQGIRESERLAPEIETALFRIIQEAIHNIAKHADASNVRVELKAMPGRIRATVEDDGCGFDQDTVFRHKVGTHSLGLLGIQERAKLLGGTLYIESKIGQGTRLTVEVPVAGTAKDGSANEDQVKTGGTNYG